MFLGTRRRLLIFEHIIDGEVCRRTERLGPGAAAAAEASIIRIIIRISGLAVDESKRPVLMNC